MKKTSIQMTNGFNVIGISIRTTNKDNRAQHDLGKLWHQFYSENIIDKIPNKLSNDILSIYTDYASDYTEDYTTIIGVQVGTLNDIPDGHIGRAFPPEKFHKIIAKGTMPNAVLDVWSDIWSKDKEWNRKYIYDFEVYGERADNGSHSEVDIYVAIQ